MLKQEEIQRTIEGIKPCFYFKSDISWYLENNIEIEKMDDNASSYSYSKILLNYQSIHEHFYPDDLTSDLSLILPVAIAIQKYLYSLFKLSININEKV